MLIDIDKIIVRDRIRKDFGDLQELADDIKANGLLNALVVTPSGEGNGTYVLIAGERRLRAMRDILGYKAVPVNSVGADDAEQALLMEISENECRKDFTKTERLEYARRLTAIEAAKARERMTLGVNDPEGGRAREKVAQALSVGDKTLRREQYIEDHQDLLDPSDFADWDEGKLSTNKAYQRIKAAQEKAERELREAQARIADLGSDLGDAQREIAALEQQNDELYDLTQKQQVVTREVTVEVVPEDYADLQRSVRELESANRMFSESNQSLRAQLEQASEGKGLKQALADAVGELASFRSRYGCYVEDSFELGRLMAAIDEFIGDR